jgi:hypothetical protein
MTARAKLQEELDRAAAFARERADNVGSGKRVEEQ